MKDRLLVRSKEEQRPHFSHCHYGELFYPEIASPTLAMTKAGRHREELFYPEIASLALAMTTCYSLSLRGAQPRSNLMEL
ncbi:MAG: hypothetical protein JSU64_08705 [candidate division WOR-3 bacterium]|nr:MAG: hypothetical protein JSU64_08705 [candidate division WOR-3 bacterium]